MSLETIKQLFKAKNYTEAKKLVFSSLETFINDLFITEQHAANKKQFAEKKQLIALLFTLDTFIEDSSFNKLAIKLLEKIKAAHTRSTQKLTQNIPFLEEFFALFYKKNTLLTDPALLQSALPVIAAGSPREIANFANLYIKNPTLLKTMTGTSLLNNILHVFAKSPAATSKILFPGFFTRLLGLSHPSHHLTGDDIVTLVKNKPTLIYRVLQSPSVFGKDYRKLLEPKHWYALCNINVNDIAQLGKHQNQWQSLLDSWKTHLQRTDKAAFTQFNEAEQKFIRELPDLSQTQVTEEIQQEDSVVIENSVQTSNGTQVQFRGKDSPSNIQRYLNSLPQTQQFTPIKTPKQQTPTPTKTPKNVVIVVPNIEENTENPQEEIITEEQEPIQSLHTQKTDTPKKTPVKKTPPPKINNTEESREKNIEEVSEEQLYQEVEEAYNVIRTPSNTGRSFTGNHSTFYQIPIEENIFEDDDDIMNGPLDGATNNSWGDLAEGPQ